MPTRKTAYTHLSEPTDDAAGMVTVDLHVLWPEGHHADVAELLDKALAELRAQVQERAAS